MERIEKLFFNECIVSVNMENGYVETVFDDKTYAPALPIINSESLYYAKDLGYGEDIKIMTIHNQILHTFLMENWGHNYSPLLWSIAHNREYEDAFWEKAEVLSFQKFMNVHKLDPLLDNGEESRKELKKLTQRARRLLEFTVLD
jgi:hypothetical protein